MLEIGIKDYFIGAFWTFLSVTRTFDVAVEVSHKPMKTNENILNETKKKVK